MGEKTVDCFALASQQTREDLIDLLTSELQCGSAEEALQSAVNGRSILDNIDIFFANAAKRTRAAGGKTADPRLADVLPVYLCTSDTESYQDCLDSIKCSKKIGYFLFTNRAERYGLEQRNKVSDTLRKNEQGIVEIGITLHACKKDFIPAMTQGASGYARVYKLTRAYLESLGAMLKSQQEVYAAESTLLSLVGDFFKNKVLEEWFTKQSAPGQAEINSLLIVLKAFRQRGIELPAFKEKLGRPHIGESLAAIQDHQKTVRAEVDVLRDIMELLHRILKHAERPENVEGGGEDTTRPAGGEGLSSKLKSWFNAG